MHASSHEPAGWFRDHGRVSAALLLPNIVLANINIRLNMITLNEQERSVP